MAAAIPVAAQDTVQPEQPREVSLEAKTAPAAADSPTVRADIDLDTGTEKPALIPTASFAGRDILWDAELSPDGNALSFLSANGEGTRLSVVDPVSGEKINAIGFAPETFVQWYQWVSPEKMLIKVYGIGSYAGYRVPVSRLILARPKEGKYDYLVENQRSLDGGRVIFVSDGGEYALIAHRGNGRMRTPSVFRYDLEVGGEVTRIQEPKFDVYSWVADDEGVVRLGIGWRNRKLNIYYRDRAEDKFRRVARFKPGDKDKYFDALQIVTGSSRGYVLDEGDDGKVGLRVFDFETREVVETFYEHPEWDIENVWIEDGEPVAAFYTDDSRQVVWFDEDEKAAYAELRDAIGDRQIWVTSRSDAGDKLLVWAGNEADPGVLYLFDREKRELTELVQLRPDIDFRLLARPQPVTYRARDGTDIRAYLTLPRGRAAKDLPLIILPHGGPFGIRDSLVYNDQVQFLANRGYAVLQPNFRGSGGYGSDFYDLGNGEVGRGMQDDLDDAMDWAVGEGIADPDRVCVVGGSYGGYAALWAVLRNPDRYRCAASWAGVTDWDKMLRHDRRYLTRKAGKRWSAKIEGDDEDFDLKDVSPYRLARGLTRPVLLAHGTLDSNVPFKQYELMVKSARKAPARLETLEIEGEGHSFSEAENEQKWYDALDAFLAKHNPADQPGETGNVLAAGSHTGSDPLRPIELAGANGDE